MELDSLVTGKAPPLHTYLTSPSQSLAWLFSSRTVHRPFVMRKYCLLHCSPLKTFSLVFAATGHSNSGCPWVLILRDCEKLLGSGRLHTGLPDLGSTFLFLSGPPPKPCILVLRISSKAKQRLPEFQTPEAAMMG